MMNKPPGKPEIDISFPTKPTKKDSYVIKPGIAIYFSTKTTSKDTYVAMMFLGVCNARHATNLVAEVCNGGPCYPLRQKAGSLARASVGSLTRYVTAICNEVCNEAKQSAVRKARLRSTSLLAAVQRKPSCCKKGGRWPRLGLGL